MNQPHVTAIAHAAMAYTGKAENMRIALFDNTLHKEASPWPTRSDLVTALASGDPLHLHNQPLVHSMFSDGGTYVVVNSRIIGPLPNDAALEPSDFEVIVPYEMSERIGHAHAVADRQLKTLVDTPKRCDVLMHLTSASNAAASLRPVVGPFETETKSRRSNEFSSKLEDAATLVSNTVEDPLIKVQAVMDPLTPLAQEWSFLLEALSHIPGVQVQLLLNPSLEHDKTPLNRFYRHVLPLHPFQDKSVATFTDLPPQLLYTVGLVTISSWIAMPSLSEHDLDNIQLNKLSAGVHATYEMRSILVEGHARDSSDQSPPRGLQLSLKSHDDVEHDSTIVMANLGYFQLKGHPGVSHLALRQGRSEHVYTLDTAGATGWTDAPLADQHYSITIDSLEGTILFPWVSKRPGQEHEDLLVDTDNPSLWERITSTLHAKKSNHADINIFSVASGHLYERFLSIMTASVMKHTSKTVKFWFIENFLSPSFKGFLPQLAARYKFKYELVTYQWPHWLRKQTEKQRLIWAYKILFLDVLFPLDLDKIIFVDADQIVRTDLYELVSMDLEGKPYAYTPFCNNRPEMDAFRFWTSGYWKNHLGHLPYHISALYVVDLVRFRQMAAGDKLRGHYHALSADPNSLANLDQDLPNDLQALVPIHSLPQDWLWCETWCSDASLKTAKTIDLCNNPLTKEPKLDRAKRQVPEWESYDEEIRKFKSGQVEGHDEL